MSLISRTITQLFGGVSQQPAQLRSDSQCELQENCWPDVAVGLSKRPPSVHLAKLNTDTEVNRAVHVINRDATEKYAVTVKDSQVKVYDLLSGAEKTVTTPDGVGYLSSTDPKADFSFVTVADTTFVVNKTKQVTLDAADLEASTRQRANIKLNSLPTNDVNCTSGGLFRITVNGVAHESSVNDYTTILQHLNALASKIQTANPSMVVVTDGVDTIILNSAPAASLTVSGYAMDETSAASVCTGAVQNDTRVTITTGSDNASNVYFVSILTAVSRQTYTITLPGLNVSFTVAADGSNALTTTIANSLANFINTGAGTWSFFGGFSYSNTDYVAVVLGSTLKISRKDGTAFTCAVKDSYGDTATLGFSDSVLSTSQLPPTFWTGYVIKVRGAIDSGQDDFYVHYEDELWKETVKPGLQNILTASTMPHKLFRNADGTFTFSKITWGQREVGDDVTNPAPSFIGQKLNNIFFFRERLGFLSGENIVMSRVAGYYDFFATTASGALDDDPIDATVSDTRVAQLYHALPFQDVLLVFSDTAQFQMTGGDVFSPKTARLNATTRFYTSKNVPPIGAGRDVYFAVDRGGYTSMREYFVLPDGVNSDAADITAHVPSYIPKNIRGIASSTLMDAVMLFSADSPNKLYAYKYLWNGEQKVQSSWGTLTFAPDVTLLGMEFIETTLYMVVRRADGTYVEAIDFQAGGTETGMSFRVYLDRRYSLTGVYDAGTNKTTWTLPHADTDTYSVVLGTAFASTGARVNTTHPTSTTLEAIGDLSAGPCFVGKPYTMRYRFSELYVKDKENVAALDGKLMLRNLSVFYSDSAYFKVEVTPSQREKNTYTFTGSRLGTASATIGSITVTSGSFKAPVITSNLGVIIDLINDSHLPSTFQGATWQGLYTIKAKPL